MKKILQGTFLFMATFSPVVYAAGQLVTESNVDIFGDG